MNAATGSSLASLLATIHGLYPQARVTSGYRGPNNPLTLRNPASMHAHGSPEDPRAVDVAPIPGVSFDQYQASIRHAGVPVAQAFDEASHPFPWTTGPNWHIAQGQAPQMAAQRKKPMSLAGLAMPGPITGINGGTWNVDGSQATPMSLDAQPLQPQATSLADLAGGLPQGHIKAPSKFNAANIMGVLGDALMAYGGMQPQFGPHLARQQDDERQIEFDREKMNAALELQRQKALEPPQFAQNAAYFNSMDPTGKRSVLQYEDATNPINVSTPQGTQNVPRTAVKTIGGKTYYSIGGEWYEEGE